MKRQNFNIVERPPRSLGTQTFWAELSYDALLSLVSTGVNEYNYAFLASSFNGFSNAATFFDQYCIYCVTIAVSSMLVEASYGAITCHSAIDYDSVSNIGKAGIMSYTSYNDTSLGSGGQTSLTRFVKPCVAPQVTSSNLPVAGGVSRQWLDIAYPNVQHYGYRMLFDAFSANVSNAVHVVFTATIGFRNNQ